VINLWKCHTENYSQFVDPDSGELKIPNTTLLYDFNSLIIRDLSGLNMKLEGDTIVCSHCQVKVGKCEMEGENRLFVQSIAGLQNDKEVFEKSMIDRIREQFYTDRLRDIFFVEAGSLRSIKVKPISILETCQGSGEQLDMTIDTSTLKVSSQLIQTE